MYQQLALVVAYLRSRLRADRGEIVPTAILWVGAGALGAALLVAAGAYIGSWVGLWPTPAVPTLP